MWPREKETDIDLKTYIRKFQEGKGRFSTFKLTIPELLNLE